MTSLKWWLRSSADQAFCDTVIGSEDVAMERLRGAGRVNDFSVDAEKSADTEQTVADPLLPAAAAAAAAPAAGAGGRLVFVDLFKGLIMVLMAVDHAKHAFVMTTDPVPLELYFQPADYSGRAAWWLTRVMTHTVAVGFAFALGVGFFFLFESRARLGWSRWRLLRYYAVRAAVLLVLEQLLTQVQCLCLFLRGQWPGYYFLSAILTMLGANMVVGSLVLMAQQRINRLSSFPWGDVAVAALAVVALVACDAVVRLALPWSLFGFVFPPLAWAFGAAMYAGGSVILLDAWIPWMPVVLLGMLLARRRLSTQSLAVALAVTSSVFILFRTLFVTTGFEFGSYRPILQPVTVFSFFGMSKYPPSLVFLCCWLSVDLAVLLLLRQLPEEWAARRPLSWLLVFGRAPLFFYALHLVVYPVLGLPFALEQTGLGGVYIEWLVGLLVCYYPTKLFGKFKLSTSKDSLWRLF